MKPVFIEVTSLVSKIAHGDVIRTTSWLNVAHILRLVPTSAADGTPRVMAHLTDGVLTLEHSIDEVLRRIKDA